MVQRGDFNMANPGPMVCPVDGATLTMSERQGIEIDYCPTCRGVWLDRGELDKIIERSAAAEGVGAAGAKGVQPVHQPAPQQYYGDDAHYRRGGHGGYRRKSFLSELFD
jgi:uncharacterized protein